MIKPWTGIENTLAIMSIIIIASQYYPQCKSIFCNIVLMIVKPIMLNLMIT